MRATICVLTIAGLAVAAPAGAASRHHSAPTAKHAKGHAAGHARRVERRTSSPAGTTAVPAGGLRLYCPGSRSPLLVRKFTQGNGTVVTALCR